MILLLFNIGIFLYFQGIKCRIITDLFFQSELYFTISIRINNI